MIQSFTVPGRLPGYNELAKGDWRKCARVKAEGKALVAVYARQAKIKPVESRVTVRIVCYEPNARRDQDNVQSGAAKCILDALQDMGIIKGDGQKYVTYIPTTPTVDRKNPRVEVSMTEEEP